MTTGQSLAVENIDFSIKSDATHTIAKSVITIAGTGTLSLSNVKFVNDGEFTAIGVPVID